MAAYQRTLFRHKKLFFLSFMVVTLFFVLQLVPISVESRTQMWFNPRDPHYVRYLEFKEQFGNDHILVIGIRSQERFYDELSIPVRKLSDRMREMEGVRSVTHIFDFDHLPPQAQPLTGWLHGFFVSEDRRSTQIIVRVTDKGSQFLRGEIIDEIRETVRREKPKGSQVYFSGSLYMGAELDRYARRNAGKAMLFTLGAIALILLVLYRRVSIVISVLLSSLIAIIWAMGFYAAMGNALNLVTNMITPLVLILSISLGIHITCRAQDELRRTPSWKEAVIKSLSHVWRPCFLASLTTSIGFFSLYFSPSKAISQFGLYAGLAMFLEFFVFFHMFPLILHSFYRPKPWADAKDGSKLREYLGRNARLIVSHKNKVILAFVLANAILAVGIFRIHVETNQMKYFDSSHEIIRSAEFFDRFFGGVYPVQAVIVSSQKETFKEQEALRKIKKFQDIAVHECDLSREISLADMFLSLKDFPFAKDLLAFSMQKDYPLFWDNLVDEEFRRTVVSFRARSGITSQEMMRIQSTLQKIAGEVFDGAGYKVEITGIMPLYAHFHEYIIKTQVLSFSIAFLLIILVIGFTFRSLSLLMAVAAANLTSIVMIFGLMGYLGINLDAGTVMIASCAIGIIVDDTIHILHRAGLELKRGNGDPDEAIRRTLEKKGRALVTTSVTVGLGFLVLLTNDFKPAQFFGILMAFTMFSALAADMLFLPSLISRFRIKIPEFRRRVP